MTKYCTSCGELSQDPHTCGLCGQHFSDESAPATQAVAPGRYKVLRDRVLGTGGFGQVLECIRHEDGQLLAYKEVNLAKAEQNTGLGEHADRAERRRRAEASFYREARALSRLHHPNIVRVYDHGRVGDDQLYMIMDLIPRGLHLNDVLSTPLSLERVLDIAVQLADAVAHAHAQGVYHRDLKPANVGIDDGHVRLLDFGIAKPLSRIAGTENTQTVGIFYTPGYAAPEILQGLKLAKPDELARIDVYGFGAIVYRMLTGDPPGSDPTEPVGPLPEQRVRPRALDDLVAACLEKDRAKRQTHMGVIARRLRGVQASVRSVGLRESLRLLAALGDSDALAQTPPARGRHSSVVALGTLGARHQPGRSPVKLGLEALLKTPMRLTRVLSIALELAEQLGRSHRLGAYHHDLRPEHIGFDARDRLQLAGLRGLNLDKPILADGSPQPVFRPSDTKYAAPEQSQAIEIDDPSPAGPPDSARVDIYGFGAVLLWMLTGAPPSKPGGVRRLPWHLARPPQLDALVADCLARDPERRPSSAAEIAQRLREIQLRMLQIDLAGELRQADAGFAAGATDPDPSTTELLVRSAVVAAAMSPALRLVPELRAQLGGLRESIERVSETPASPTREGLGWRTVAAGLMIALVAGLGGYVAGYAMGASAKPPATAIVSPAPAPPPPKPPELLSQLCVPGGNSVAVRQMPHGLRLLDDLSSVEAAAKEGNGSLVIPKATVLQTCGGEPVMPVDGLELCFNRAIAGAKKDALLVPVTVSVQRPDGVRQDLDLEVAVTR